MVHNFRFSSAADIAPKQPGYFEFKEGCHEYDGKGKHKEKCFAGSSLGCIRLRISDSFSNFSIEADMRFNALPPKAW